LCPAAQRLLFILEGDIFPVSSAGIQSASSTHEYAESLTLLSLFNI